MKQHIWKVDLIVILVSVFILMGVANVSHFGGSVVRWFGGSDFIQNYISFAGAFCMETCDKLEEVMLK